MSRKLAALAAAAGAAVLAGGVVPAASADPVTWVACNTPALVSAISGAASGATLALPPACTYVLTEALPTLNNDLTIDGNGATLQRSTADGTPLFTIMTIADGTIALNWLSFSNGDGAILANEGDLTVTGGVFRDNNAANGAAIGTLYNYFNSDVGLTVSNAAFIGNSATGGGGAINFSSKNGNGLTVSDCRFVGNTAADGGAIETADDGNSISGSLFRGNTATDGNGGALSVSTVSGSYVVNSVLRDNSASGSGGAIEDRSSGEPVNIDGDTITGNHAGGVGGGLDEEADGQAATVTGSLDNTIVTHNSAADGGGIFYNPNADVENQGDTISDNYASDDGGGIDSSADILFYGTTVSGNRAGGDGGGFYDGDNPYGAGPVGFTNGRISGNYAVGLGGGVYNQQRLILANSTVTRNRADGGGGGIYQDNSVVYSLVWLSFSPVTRNRPDNCEPLGSITGCTG